MNAESNIDNEIDVQQLLVKWGFEELIDDFASKQIDIECFKEMTENDIQNLIPCEKFGLRIKFRARLLKCRQVNSFSVTALADAETLSSKVTNSSFSINPGSPSSSSTTAQSVEIIDKFKDLQSILKESFVGKPILEIALKKEPLPIKSRNDLCDTIAHYWVVSNIEHVLSSQYCRKIVDEIIILFPLEDKEYYINSDKNIKGKLAQKYYSLLRKYREKGIIKSKYNNKRAKTVTEVQEIISEPVDETLIGNQLWLKSNKQPEALVVEKWRNSFRLRMLHVKSGQDIFTEWPILKQQIGISLIELHFENIYPCKSQLFYSKWDDFKIKLIAYYNKNIKDCTSKKYLSILGTEISNDSADYLTCILLNSILIPNGIHTKKDGKKFFWKPSIVEGQEFMAIHILTEYDIENTVLRHRKKLFERGLTNQPILIVVGELNNLKKFFVNIHNYFYELDGFKKSLSVYEFLVSYFYEIKVDSKPSIQLIQLLAEFKN